MPQWVLSTSVRRLRSSFCWQRKPFGVQIRKGLPTFWPRMTAAARTRPAFLLHLAVGTRPRGTCVLMQRGPFFVWMIWNATANSRWKILRHPKGRASRGSTSSSCAPKSLGNSTSYVEIT